MKKTIYSIALLALFTLTTKAQEPKKETKKQPTSLEEAPKATSTGDEGPKKKGGTRMAINEKGLPNTKTKSQNETKEAPKEGTKTQPGANKE